MKMKERRTLVGVLRPPLPPAFPVVGEDARARSRLHSLMQDFEELLKETAAKRRRLQMGRQRVLNLTAEVKFLRRRYKYLINNPPPTPCVVNDQLSQKVPSRPEHKAKKTPAAFNSPHKNGECVRYGQQSQPDSSSSISSREKDVVVPSPPAVLDLNKIFLPDGEEEALHATWDPLPMKSSGRNLSDGDDVAGGEPVPLVCRDVGSRTNRTGKRKISWQDQVALKV